MTETAVFGDLKDAIKDVINSSCSTKLFNFSNVDDRKNHKLYVVNGDALRILQAEYNIHFVEPEHSQLNVV